MADVAKNGQVEEEEDWEYEEEEGEDYEWEYETESEENPAADINDKNEEEDDDEIDLEDQDLPDPFSAAPLQATTKTAKDSSSTAKTNGHENGTSSKSKHKDRNGENGVDENGDEKRHHRKHKKKSRHLERMEVFKKKDGNEDEYRNKKIHVRSKDPSRIARQFEKTSSSSKSKKSRDKGKVIPPPQKVNQICKICGKEPYLVERIVAEKSWWCKNCFRCNTCNKILNLDTYMSHEGVLYCKPHHQELFRPKAVFNDILNEKKEAKKPRDKTQEILEFHKEQERRMETIIRENDPVDLGDDVVKCKAVDREAKYSGLENLDVGSKFKMFENGGDEDDAPRGPSSDRYGIMEKLKRLQEGEDLDDLLAEMDDEFPVVSESEEDEDLYGLTEVQKRTMNPERLFGEQEKRDRMANDRKKDLTKMREKLMMGSTDNAMDNLSDLRNASANKIKKTKVDVKSQNAKRFREMFDKGEVPEGMSSSDRTILEKDAELEIMRKNKSEQRDYFKKLEEGKMDNQEHKEPKLMVGRIKDKLADGGEEFNEDVPEMASVASKFSFFEKQKEREEEERQKKQSRKTPPRLTKSHIFEDPGEDEDEGGTKKKGLSEIDHARRDCKARSVLNKFKQMEQKMLNGEDEDEVGDKPRMKRFTPPRGQSGSDYSDSDDDSGSYYSSSYTSSSYSDSDSEEEVDETLRAMRDAKRAAALRSKFEKWETSKDAQDQARQMMIHDENGEALETAGNLKARFEMLQMQDTTPPPVRTKKFVPKRFK